MLMIVWVLLFGIVIFGSLIYSFIKLYKYFLTKNSDFLIASIKPWLYLFLSFFLIIYIKWCSSKIEIDRNEITGVYEIDSSFYPGKNADWQKEHFRFRVALDGEFIFYERLSDGSEKKYIGRVSWANENPEKWSIHMQTYHQVIDQHPILYRGRNKFYYVFRSKKYGNMFFRKVSNS